MAERGSFLSSTAIVLKVLLAVMFLFSAATKFVSIETFELYIFSFNVLSLGISSIMARLAIASELLLGVWLLSGRGHRWACVVTSLLLLFFSIFLACVLLIGRSDSCNCFGELLPFTPVQSLLKNAVLLMVVLLVWKWGDARWRSPWWLAVPLSLVPAALLVVLGLMGKASMRVVDAELLAVLFAVVVVMSLLLSFRRLHQWWLYWLIALAPVVTLFILVPPNGWFRLHEEESFDREQFYTSLSDSIDGERQVVAFFSAGCTYCLHTAQMIGGVQQRNHLDTASFLYVFPDQQISKVDTFYSAARSPHYRQVSIPTHDWIAIVQGRFPVVAFVDHDTIQQVFSYGAVGEKEIVRFLK